MDETQLIATTKEFVKNQLLHAEKGHDWAHIERVYTNALKLLEFENADRIVVELAALLHDIADPKFHGGDESIGPAIAKKYLLSQNIADNIIDHVVRIIENMSFKSSLGTLHFKSIEMDIVQDADRLDAIGAIGIARAFHYGGFKNREIYNPTIPPNLNMSKDEYKNSTAPTINHFYEKLLLLKDKMNTNAGKKMAEERHVFMERFLKQFYSEVNA